MLLKKTIMKSPLTALKCIVLLGSLGFAIVSVEPQAGAQKLPGPKGLPPQPSPQTQPQPTQPQPRPQMSERVLTKQAVVTERFRLCCLIVDIQQKAIQAQQLPGKIGRAMTVTVLSVRDNASGNVFQLRGAAGKRYNKGQTVYSNVQGQKATAGYPTQLQRRDEIGKSSRKMETSVTLDNTGVINAWTRTWTAEAAVGFTGGVMAVLTDIDGKVLHKTQPKYYGVNGTAVPGAASDITKNWSEKVPVELLNKSAGIAIAHWYAPKSRLPQFIENVQEFVKFVKDAYQLYQDLKVIFEEPEPGVAGPGGPGQCPPGAIC